MPPKGRGLPTSPTRGTPTRRDVTNAPRPDAPTSPGGPAGASSRDRHSPARETVTNVSPPGSPASPGGAARAPRRRSSSRKPTNASSAGAPGPTSEPASIAYPGGLDITQPAGLGFQPGMDGGTLPGPATDGWEAGSLFDGSSITYTYDDIVFMPGQSFQERAVVDLKTYVTRNVQLNVPIVTAPEDTVTETAMAVSVALVGGMGIIHCKQPIQRQADMVRYTKGASCGLITDPVTLGPANTLEEMSKALHGRGFSSVMVTDTGQVGGRLLGLVTARDAASEDDRSTLLSDVMVTEVITAPDPITIEEAQTRMRREKVGRLPIVDADGRLVALVTRGDFKRMQKHPDAARDLNGMLRVGAAVVVDEPTSWERASALAEAGADVLCVEGGHGIHADAQVQFISRLKEEYPKTDVLAGPVTTCRAGKRLMDAGADGLRVGSTASANGIAGEVVAVGRCEATSVYELSRYLRLNFNSAPLVAEGGLHNAGHILKALGLGASVCMLGGSLLAGADDAPGAGFVHNGSQMKLHHGADPAQVLREVHQVPDPLLHLQKVPYSGEGMGSGMPGKAAWGRGQAHASVRVGCNSSARNMLPYFLRGLRAGMLDVNILSIPGLHTALLDGELRLETRCPFAVQQAALKAAELRQSPHPYIMPVR